MREKKDTRLNLKTSEAFIQRLMRASALTDRPASQIAREAISEKLDEMAERFPEIDEQPAERQEALAA